MSYAVTQKQQHIHLPWTAIITLGLAVLVAVAVLIFAGQQGTQTVTVPAEVAPVAVALDAAAVPVPESPALRHRLALEVATRVPQSEQFAYPRNHVAGTTLAPLGAGIVTGSAALQAAPNDPHPYNHFQSEP